MISQSDARSSTVRRQSRASAKPAPTANHVDLDEALLSPSCVFRHPDDVVEDPTLTRAQKIDILEGWLSEATALSVAENEGMGGGEAADIEIVAAALDRAKANLDSTGPED